MADEPPPTLRSDRTSRTRIELPPPGYNLGEVIGRGGMGEVIAAHDLRIGRDIAIKRLHGTPSDAALARFLREARIQARLDHPAIVPVHELGIDAEGRPFFAMKRLSGTTLADRLAAGAPTQPLLRAFAEVCRAIDLAHARGVIHRDLKPANIVLGDYGEVHVIDWGIARELDRGHEDVRPGIEDREAAPGLTRDGAVLGTPGYMSPEQVRGDEAGRPSDVYALGSMLFELLAREPLHPRGKEALITTLTGAPDAPSKRRPELAVPPELDAICHAALADEPADRPTANALAMAIEKYLDGDRDLERRRTLAGEQLDRARQALAAGGPEARAVALRHAGRALALDPEYTEAADLVTRLLVERPDVFPPGLVASLKESESDSLRKRSRRAVMAYAAVFAFLALVPILTVRSWPWLVAFFAAQAGQLAFAFYGWRTGRVNPFLSMLGNFLLAVVWTRLGGPFALTPMLICGASIAVASHPWNQERPWTIFAWILATVLTPFALEGLGVFASTWTLVDGAVLVTSPIFRIDGAGAAGALVTAHTLLLLLVGSFAFTVTRTARDAQREQQIQAWHLRHLLPDRT